MEESEGRIYDELLQGAACSSKETYELFSMNEASVVRLSQDCLESRQSSTTSRSLSSV
jgi:hypothetical protein